MKAEKMASGGPYITPKSLRKDIKKIRPAIETIVNPKLKEFTTFLREFKIDLEFMAIEKIDPELMHLYTKEKIAVNNTLAKIKSFNANLTLLETFFITTTDLLATNLRRCDQSSVLTVEETETLTSYKDTREEYPPYTTPLMGLALDVKKFQIAFKERLESIKNIDIAALSEELKSHSQADLMEGINDAQKRYQDLNNFDADFLDPSDGEFSFGSTDYNVTATMLEALALSSSRTFTPGAELHFSSSEESEVDLSAFPTPPSLSTSPSPTH